MILVDHIRSLLQFQKYMTENIEQNYRKPSLEEISEAKLYKQQGNELFKEKSYQQAMKMYQKAIERDPTCSIYYSNKSRCLFNLKRYDEAFLDAQQALKYDQKNIKAHYLAAQCLVQISEGTKDKQKLSKAIQKLKRSLILCPSQGKGQFQRNFVDKIYKAKKKLWLMANQQQMQKKKALRKYLVHLVETDNQLQEHIKDQLHQKIAKLVQNDIGKEYSKIPPALICPITKKLLNDPVCNQYGHSYSREDYLKYLYEHEGKDPLTQKQVKKRELMYFNINVKKAIQLFLEQHPWAYDQVIPV